MGIEEIFANYIKNMEDDRYTGYQAFTNPYTTKNFMQLFNFNDPEVEKKWLEETLINQAMGIKEGKGIDIEGYEYSICYL